MKKFLSSALSFLNRNKYALMLIIISETNHLEKTKKKERKLKK